MRSEGRFERIAVRDEPDDRVLRDDSWDTLCALSDRDLDEQDARELGESLSRFLPLSSIKPEGRLIELFGPDPDDERDAA